MVDEMGIWRLFKKKRVLPTNYEEFFRKVHERLYPKVLKDIDFILEEGWCAEVSPFDLYHVHLCKESSEPISGVDELLSLDDTRLLYHGSEKSFFPPRFFKRNIASSLYLPPKVIPVEYIPYVDVHGYHGYIYRKPTVHSSDLGWSEYGKIEFTTNPEGRYKLANGVRLSMSTRLHSYALDPSGPMWRPR